MEPAGFEVSFLLVTRLYAVTIDFEIDLPAACTQMSEGVVEQIMNITAMEMEYLPFYKMH